MPFRRAFQTGSRTMRPRLTAGASLGIAPARITAQRSVAFASTIEAGMHMLLMAVSAFYHFGLCLKFGPNRTNAASYRLPAYLHCTLTVTISIPTAFCMSHSVPCPCMRAGFTACSHAPPISSERSPVRTTFSTADSVQRSLVRCCARPCSR